ncbi:hypothetical protein ACK83U_15965 [Rhizobium sp. WW22]|uniref:hypothetical protein n=1 Tax=Rhizobium sp. WW22 TaxID=3389070 RepID=UPI00399962C4
MAARRPIPEFGNRIGAVARVMPEPQENVVVTIEYGLHCLSRTKRSSERMESGQNRKADRIRHTQMKKICICMELHIRMEKGGANTPP